MKELVTVIQQIKLLPHSRVNEPSVDDENSDNRNIFTFKYASETVADKAVKLNLAQDWEL